MITTLPESELSEVACKHCNTQESIPSKFLPFGWTTGYVCRDCWGNVTPAPPPASTLLLHQLRLSRDLERVKNQLPRHEWAEFVAGLGSYATEELGRMCTRSET